MSTTLSADPVSILLNLTEEDVLRHLDELARQEKQLRALLRSVRRRKREDIQAKRLPPIEEVSRV
jgi:hypothetical protein